ncbi:MAG: ABC transporter permease [Flammeovirgaceae bacterium]|nr:ABC transporter permease [Flammeovirgaceae bacterium]
MKQLIYFIRKEFYHVLRDTRTLIILFGMPIAQIVIFGFALTNEVKDSRIVILDLAKDETSRAIIDEISVSRYFDLTGYLNSNDEIERTFREGKTRMVIVFPPQLQYELSHNKSSTIQLIADATDPNVANTLVSYASTIIMDFQRNTTGLSFPLDIKTEIRMLYNPQLKGSYSFVPGVMALVLMLVGAMMTSISIVREKELGTMEVILVSPIIPFRVIIAKMIPYLVLSMINVISILSLSYFVLDVPIVGNLFLLLVECFLFTLTALALGLFISSVSDTQQTAMLISLMALFLPTVMFSGFMFPIENMPVPLQLLSNLIPAKWFFYIVRDVMIMGTGFDQVWKETVILIIMLIVLILVSIKKFKVRLA